MRKAIAQHGTTIVVAAVVAALTAAAPTIAASAKSALARNSDKVDGIHAVTAKQARTLKQRRGKLVATDTRTGLLPVQVIPKLGGDKIATASLGVVPRAGHATTADKAASALSAQNASTVNGLHVSQIVRNYGVRLEQIGPTTLNVPVPGNGMLTWSASCEFIENDVADAAVMTRSFVGSPSGSFLERSVILGKVGAGPIHKGSVRVEEYAAVRAGETRTIEVVPTHSCGSGRLIVHFASIGV